MGNPNTQSSSSINHFSHPHPLQLSNQSQKPLTAISCSGCNLDTSVGLVYSCTICNYVLHTKCSQMPQQITHPADPKHVLSLLPKPLYAKGVYKCDACGQEGNGFSYNCQSCNIDLHILCASMPMTLIHQSHQHKLDLTFSPPYPSKTFSCDLCKRAGSNQWLYRCSSCEFDVHLTCSNKQTSQPPAQQGQGQAPQRVATIQQTRNLQFTPPISQQPLYSVQQTIPQRPGLGSPFQPQFQQPMFQNMVTTRPVFANPNNLVYSTNPINTSAFTSNINPISYSPFMSGARVQNLPQAQVFVQPYARTGPMQQSLLARPNYMNTGAVGPAGYSQQNMLIRDQMIIGAANGVASGASQAITEATVQDFMVGGNMNVADVGGFGGDMNGYNVTPDVMTMDQGTYGMSDYRYDQTNVDAGIMAGEMNQMMDENQFDPGMAGEDMSLMQLEYGTYV